MVQRLATRASGLHVNAQILFDLPLADVFDPTGAGDTFAGGFIGYLAKVGTINFNNMKNAIIYGSALASFCVEKFGTEKIKNLTEQEVTSRIREFVNLSSFVIEK